MKTQVKRTKCLSLGRSRRAGRPSLAVAFLVAAVGWSVVAPTGSYARVNPLVIIERQIHKANMLIVLDTSGSMTGVPGGTFSSVTEAGVDCKNGVNCKASGIQAACKQSGQVCMTDADCRVGHCSLTSSVTCSTNNDCPVLASKCSLTSDTCTTDANCPRQASTCSVTGANCDTTPCATYAKCQYGGAVCTNPGGNCAAVNYCAKDPTKTCTTDAECPQASSGGNCAAGGTPPSGCSTQEDCPVKTRCATTDETCQGAADCPGPSKGRCSDDGSACNNNNNCTGTATCVYWTNACIGPTNPCTLPHSKCDSIPSSKNPCVAQTNTCTTHPNTCVSPGTNSCVLPSSTTDTCIETARGAPGPIRMCANAMTVCNSSADCPTGDTCGAATSRMMIAKQSINSLVANNYNTVNFGLMTFFQNGYFPYYPPATGGTTTTTVTVFEDRDKLVANGCFDVTWGPTPYCTIAGTTLQLQKLQNSLYTVPIGPETSIPANQNYCGLFCDIKPSIGTGAYNGSYYTYTGSTGNANATALVQPTYTGKNITVGGTNYTYYDALPNYYSGGTPPPFTFTNCEVTKACGPRCGGRWDPTLAPFIDTTDNPATAQSNALALAKALEPASYGGLMAFWSTPTGCTLENTGTPTVNASAYHYMQTVKNGDSSMGIAPDPLRCRGNYVMLVTDGAANGPGDIDSGNNSTCAVAACADADPVAAGCTCASVLAAWHLRQNLGVKTFVVGFAGDAAKGTVAETINDNIARAGGTDAGDDGVAPFAYLAQNDTELATALQMAVLNAIKGSYSTAPTSSSAGTQQATTVAEGRYALDSRMDFPQWKGHLLAYDLLTNGTPCVNNPSMMCPNIVWDAYTMMQRTDWKSRRIYTWDGTSMVRFQVAADGTVPNQAALAALGLGSTPEEAGRVVHWVMGDPAYANPAVLGAIVNSTPIDIASPGDIPLPGGHDFFLRYQNRPHLVYVGSSDGMVHAFFLENTTLGPTTYPAGTEAFAFAPPEMLNVIRRQYVQGGQRPSPYDHIFGIADSPKAKTMCVSGCSDAATAVWKTLLLQTEGYGGTESFVLDVTTPFSSSGIADPPVNVQWHSGYGTSATMYNWALGMTVSLPAFLFNKTSTLDDFRLIFTSGYPLTVGGSTTQGRQLITASARNGTIVTQNALTPNGACTVEYTNLTDVATARDFAKNQDDKLIAGYFGDTHGQLWRYKLGHAPVVAMDFTCNHPLHFAPTVVQLDRDSLNSGHAHEIYPVQVTNSNLDFDTISMPPSKMVFWKEIATTESDGSIENVSRDLTWNNNLGKIELTVGVDSQICGVTQVDAQGHVSCKTSMPTIARPTATPLGLLKSDASGFQVFTMWYAPSEDSCTRGQTYFTIHEVLASGSYTQKVGAMVAAEPVTSPVVMHGQIMLFGAGGAYNITGTSPSSISTGLAIPPPAPGSGAEFLRYNWTEILQ